MRFAPDAVHSALGRRDDSPVLFGAAVVAAALLLAYFLAAVPFFSAGVGFGVLLLVCILLRPLVVIGVMLAIGPLDLSFVTGGFKNLFPELGGLDMNGIRLIGMVGGLSVLAVLDRNVLRELFGRNGRWYVLFLLFAAVTIGSSLSPLDGLRLLLKLSYPLLIFLIVVGVARTERDLSFLGDMTLWGAAVIAVLLNPLFVLAGGYETDLTSGLVRVQGAGLHQNPFSFYLLAMLLFAAARFIVRRQVRYLLLTLIFSSWMVLSLTRITLAASLAALFALALYAALVHRDYRALIGATVLGLLIAIPLTPLVLERTFYGRVPDLAELIALARNPIALYETMNWQGRELLWAVVGAAFLQSPIFGLGLGSTSAILRENFPVEAGLVVHNEYLRLLAETGLVGVALFALAMIRWFGAAVLAGRTQTALVKEWALPAIAVLLAWTLIAATDNPFDYYAPFTQYAGLFCGGAIVAARIASADAEEAESHDTAPALESA